jgi:nucleoside-diphosphate-sugar epimerase
MTGRVLVTGGSGLLGRHVVRRLARDGVAVRALVRAPESVAIAEAAGASEVQVADLRDPDAVVRATAGVDAVYHCAAHVRRKGGWADFEEINVRATERLLAASERAGVEVFVHVSSVGIYPLPRDGETVTEETAADPIAHRRGAYTHSKALADALVTGWTPARPMRIVVVRPGHIWGAERPMFGRLARPVAGRHWVVIAARDSLIGFTWVENCADALVEASRRAPAGTSRYLVVDDPTLTQRRFLEAVERQAPGRYRFTYLPVPRLAPLLRRLPLPLAGRERVYRLLRACCSVPFSTERARRELGWSPPVPLDEAVGRMLAALAAAPASTPATVPQVARSAS